MVKGAKIKTIQDQKIGLYNKLEKRKKENPMNMKKFLALALALVMVFALAACASTTDDETTDATDELTEDLTEALVDYEGQNVAVLWYTYSDTYISSVRTALNGKLEDLGIEYTDYDSNSSQTLQAEQVDTAITTGATCLIVNIVETSSEDAAVSIVEKAQAADIPVIFFNREVSDDVVNSYDKCSYVGTSADEAGIMQGQMIGEYLVENFDAVDLNGDGVIQYVMLKGQEGNLEAENRTKYAVEYANEALVEAGKAELAFYDDSNTDLYLVDKNGTWSSTAGNEYLVTILSEYNDANGNMVELIIANNDGMAEGAISAIQDAGYNTGVDGEPIIPVFGVDATDAAVALISEGKMVGTIKQDADGMAQGIMDVLVNVAEGADSIMDGIDEIYNVDESVAKIRIPYAIYTGE